MGVNQVIASFDVKDAPQPSALSDTEKDAEI